MARKALFLAGGGARGAYQAGALKAIHEILKCNTLPFNMLTGVSIGSFNSAIIAQHADNFSDGILHLETLWREIQCQKIFNSSNYQLGKSVFRNLSHMLVKQRQSGYLLDTTPLHSFIQQNIDFNKIKESLNNKILNTIEVISNCYETQQTISFYQHNSEQFEDWHYPRHLSKRADLNREHILASSALPLFFPAVKIDGFHYGDGSMGLVAPLRGLVRFDMERILVIGTRPPSKVVNVKRYGEEIGFASILGHMLNGVFLDNLDRDIEMLTHMNDIARLLSMWRKRKASWRPISILQIRPSADFSQIAKQYYPTMPGLLRMMLNMLGAQNESGDLLGFLLFEKEFTSELIEMGYRDTLAMSEKINDFFA